ncbi:hypothetical protein L9F63_003153 [Diploptera punctata]|uniref:Poly [ADP-ribose] polymerase n=1 Tax=Diploptera punctata TaxID=6984 RepID=A0AAD8E9N3_DIPPU|nr:hypothetical protein L9F63_003153 [Diploptera punctata]
MRNTGFLLLFSGLYELKKEEYFSRYGRVNEEKLFHATGYLNVASILQENFDWRRCNRTKFGQGISFSSDAYYANKHCNKNNPDDRAMICAKVLVSEECEGFENLLLPLSCDTSTGNNDRVKVKFYDNEFYPAYVARYTNPNTVNKCRRFHRK